MIPGRDHYTCFLDTSPLLEPGHHQTGEMAPKTWAERYKGECGSSARPEWEKTNMQKHTPQNPRSLCISLAGPTGPCPLWPERTPGVHDMPS